MSWEIFEPYIEYAKPAAITLAALLILWLIIRTIGGKISGRRGNRLAVSEFHEIDKSRRLVLVRRDDVEHLIMIGGNQDMVIEAGIGAGNFAAKSHQPAAMPSLDIHASRDTSQGSGQDGQVTSLTARPPKPAVFGDRAPNLRPVERTEPKLQPVEPGSKSS